MYFTKQDYEKILGYILDHSKKDTNFETTQTITGDELLSLVQEGINKNVTLDKLLQLIDEHGIEVKIEQEEGDYVNRTMSQKTITESLEDIRDVIDIDAEKGTIQQQLDEINEHIGGPSEESIQSQIDDINETIGGEGPDSVQNQLKSLRETRLIKGSTTTGGDVVDNLNTTNSNIPLSANQGKILKDEIDDLNGTVETFIHTTVVDRGMAVSISDKILKFEFDPSDLNTIYIQQTGNTISFTNATIS